MDWPVSEGFFDASALTFAVMYFGVHRRANMLKSVNGNNLERARAGIRNAAWDLTYLSQWVRRSRQEPEHPWMFCTNDRVLAELGNYLVTDETDQSLSALSTVFDRHWSKRDAEALLAHYQHCWDVVCRSPDRPHLVHERLRHLEEITGIVEQELSRTFPAPDGRTG